ncbi:type II toxin-antitoxin system VapC family toxin [Thauera butanivorans]|jgi:predicted nucleic-acid-binding protein|uniref:type II toxin-antitoxin system VapC family toxin n=1 Tax=Thauera butanivorans TaxID=86174 RepID=UPI000839326C|nr:type II toxin-antitoxin system VapC family toxin [Thauera butanivorans]
MKAVDTNVLARFFVDDPDDLEAARRRPAALEAMRGRVFVSVTVLLELEWVLRGFYELPRASIHRALSALCTYGNVVVEDRARVLAALQAFEQGLDFADALHLSRAASCTALLTFDKRFIKRASSLPDAIPCEQPRSS